MNEHEAITTVTQAPDQYTARRKPSDEHTFRIVVLPPAGYGDAWAGSAPVVGR